MSGSAMVVFDSQGNYGSQVSSGLGGLLVAAFTGGIQIQFTNADVITDLAGQSVQIGGSLKVGIGIGAEAVYGSPATSDEYGGVNINLGIGGSAEGHIITEIADVCKWN